MPRIPHPDDMPRAALDPATNPAQLNVGVASRIGQAGRAMGNAIEAIGSAFGEVAGRLGTANDAVAEGNAKLETLKGLDAADLDMAANAGEDGATWQTAPDRYKQVHSDIDSRYQIADPRRRAAFDLWREEQTYRRGTAAARNYQGAQRGLFTRGFDSDVAGLEERIAKGEVDPAQFNEYYGALDGKLTGMDRTVLSQADIEQKRRELQGRLTMSLDRYLSSKAPQERAAFWDQVSKGRYELDAPGSANRAGSPGEYLRSRLAPGYEKRTSDVDNLHPVMQDRLAAFVAAAEDAGHDIRVVSGHRDEKRQAVLWRQAVQKYGSEAEALEWVAPPGRSTHQSGEAVDLQYGDRGAGLGGKRTAAVAWAHQNAARFGLNFPLAHEDWHIEPTEARAGGRRFGGSYDTSKRFWQGAPRTQSGSLPSIQSTPELTQRVTPEQYFAGRAEAATLPLGMRISNNPTNIKFSGSDWQRQNFPGLVGPSTAKDEGDPQAQFANPLAGMVAGARLALLKNREQGLDTVDKIITDRSRGWTPGYKGAAEHIAKLMGVRPSDKIDLSDPATMQKFMRALITQEHGKAGDLYPDTLISQGVQIAMGRGAPAPAQRGLTQVAGLRSANDAVKSDAVQPPPGIQVGPPGANDNTERAAVNIMADLGEDADKIAAAASDNPDMPVSKVIDTKRIAQLAEKYEAFRSVEDADSLTVAEFADLAKVAEQEAGDVAERDAQSQQSAGGVGRDALVRVADAGGPSGGIPRGRLMPGQEFSVKTPRGEFKVPAEWINAIPEKLRQEYAKRAREDARIYERTLRATADDMMKSQEAHVAEHGRDAPDYDVRAVQAAYRGDPAKIAAHARRIREGKALHEAFRTAPDMPDDEIVKRLESLRPKPGTPRANEVKDIFDKAEDRVASLLKQREQDPGGAVESSKVVQGVRERLVGGQPRNKLDQVALIDARLKAQALLEIGEEARQPLPAREASALAAPLRGAEPGVFMERIEALHKGIREKYGDRFSGLIVRQVLGTFTRDKEKAKALEGALNELDEGGRVSPTTMARIRAMENVTRQSEMLGPPKPQDPGLMDRIYGIGQRLGATVLPQEPINPPKEAVFYLRNNPQTAAEFERTFRLRAGGAARYLLPE